VNETLWEHLDAWGRGMLEVYTAVTESACRAFPEEYAQVFLEARDEWLALY
jgi:hypothetical protein